MWRVRLSADAFCNTPLGLELAYIPAVRPSADGNGITSCARFGEQDESSGALPGAVRSGHHARPDTAGVSA